MSNVLLTSIGLKNIKSIKDPLLLELAPRATVLIGENGSGKSTFVQILPLIKQNIKSENLNDGPTIKLGGFEKMVNDASGPIEITLNGTILASNQIFENFENLDYSIVLTYGRQGLYRKVLKLRFNELSKKERRMFAQQKTDQEYDFSVTNRYHVYSKPSLFFVSRKLGDVVGLQVRMSVSGAIPTLIAEGKDLSGLQRDAAVQLQRFNSSIEKDLKESLVYVPSFRGIYDFEYPLLESSDASEPRGTNVDRLFLRLAAYNKNAEEKVSEIISDILDRKFRINLLEGPSVSAEIFNGRKWINVLNEGSGINTLIFLIFSLLTAPRGSLTLIEEPEIYLHPSAQRRLINAIYRIAKENDKRIVITTHSIVTLLPFAQRLYEEKQDSDSRIFFFKRDKDSLATSITEVTKKNSNGILKDFITLSNDDIANIFELSGRG